jgi:tetratricopeptide (TPR) repeat protein
LLLMYLSVTKSTAQKFADKSYYLVDSLVLTSLNADDRVLIDSCLKNFHKAGHDTAKVQALNGICMGMLDNSWHNYQYVQYDLIRAALQKYSSDKIITRNLKTALASALNNIGFIYDGKGNPLKALEFYTKAQETYKELSDKEGIGDCYNNLAAVYESQGNIPAALESYQLAQQIFKELNNKQGAASILNNIAGIHLKQGESKDAIIYYNESLKLYEEISASADEAVARSGKNGLAHSFNNIGTIHFNNHNFSLAAQYYRRSLKIREAIGDKEGMGSCLINLGDVYKSIGKPKEALDYYLKSLAIRENISDLEGVSFTLAHIGSLYLKYGSDLALQKKVSEKKAIELGERGLKIGLELGFPAAIDPNAALLSLVYKQTGNWRKALEMYELHIRMRDSLNSQSASKAAARQILKYEYEKHQAVKDKEHENQMTLASVEKKRQDVIIYAVSSGLLLMLVLVAVVFKSLQNNRRKSKIISDQKDEVDEAYKKLNEKNKEVMASIYYAGRIQSSLLPREKYIGNILRRIMKN